MLRHNFSDIHPPLTAPQAVIEAERCLRCHDAPCIEACPTGIDIPAFINRIATGDVKGAASAILSSNILGGSCARVCPTEILCEGVCVRVTLGEPAVEIAALQRHATDWQMAHGPAFTRAAATGRRIAVIGAGPAGLACAHRLALLGHEVTLFEKAARPGGLNEYGIAAYKLVDDFARREIDFVLGIGGITLHTGMTLGKDISLEDLREAFDAVFLGLGLSGVRALGLRGETLPHVRDAVAFIAELRQAKDPGEIAVGRRVVVIGGGNTAIDAAVQCRKLGAEEVTLVYRRGPESMSATRDEQDFALRNGVVIRHHARPQHFEGGPGGVTAAVFLRADGETLTLPADLVLKAVGQLYEDGPPALETGSGRLWTDGFGRTSLPRVYAGGDCVGGQELTVAAVAMGRDAAMTIHRDLEEPRHG
ncbi:NAD(P)-dependent oxidoreductase [Acidomonas methanolica]|uniref:NAD(P)-dependent oxidoreductase n=1 Tax=Acidomonas methanolica TaxID=437 RepID=UPI00211A5C7B|nr:NAD(P)-dependent oxidoreductase [Acidomonas methanolica]MCQ9154793.1 NAD(P)-dependent oxidoreductase [Acidomonas methanolica]